MSIATLVASRSVRDYLICVSDETVSCATVLLGSVKCLPHPQDSGTRPRWVAPNPTLWIYWALDLTVEIAVVCFFLRSEQYSGRTLTERSRIRRIGRLRFTKPVLVERSEVTPPPQWLSFPEKTRFFTLFLPKMRRFPRS
ncbi:hypothetical protein B296_00010544 [Ensete ventricosum]|uniref:Uncharacterized protein n=1 Tax=Ensete ventricosum TaxID=4639 RepID=A0A426ZMU4_ENSVE|nr:hypothetical protein B296_00010544 [Ensete ventricosum]